MSCRNNSEPLWKLKHRQEFQAESKSLEDCYVDFRHCWYLVWHVQAHTEKRHQRPWKWRTVFVFENIFLQLPVCKMNWKLHVFRISHVLRNVKIKKRSKKKRMVRYLKRQYFMVWWRKRRQKEILMIWEWLVGVSV